MGVSDVANFIPELWANRALGRLPSYLNLARTVQKDASFDVAAAGDTLHIPKRGNLTANAKAADTAVTKQFPQSTKVDVTLDQHWEVTLMIEDVARAQTNQDVMDGYLNDGIIALAEKIETTIANAAYIGAGDIIDWGSSVDQADLLSVRKAFVDAKYPRIAPKYLYIAPEEINDILLLSAFTDVSKYGPNVASMEGELGRIYGMKVFESQLVPTSGSPTTRHNLAYGEDGIILVSRSLPKNPASYGVEQTVVVDQGTGLALRVSKTFNADYLAVQVTMEALFGVAVQREEHVFDLTST